MGVDWVVKVHCRRGSTSLLAKGKGVHREVGSEGSWRQTHGPMNKNLIRGYAVRMSWQDTAKSKGCQRAAAEYMRRARGRSTLLPGEACRIRQGTGNPDREVRLNRQESAEGIVPRRS
ncbi:protein of unknown function [Kyrpidia spormannii]|uniref:Uncharacterized protein n=1 Tax=Kyrpidia spormannii TaxID=2055160 RepID=A0ACA8Z5E3_9BACL|nr:protein of unknown function [Kyrpidia spormannii]